MGHGFGEPCSWRKVFAWTGLFGARKKNQGNGLTKKSQNRIALFWPLLYNTIDVKYLKGDIRVRKVISVVLVVSIMMIFSACAKEASQTPAEKALDESQRVSADSSSRSDAVLEGGFSVTAENAAVSAGQEFGVPIQISEASGIALFDLVISYDSEKLTFNSFEENPQMGFFDYNEQEKGSILIAMVSANPPAGEIVFGTLQFTAKGEATGQSTIHLSYTDCMNAEGQELYPELQDATVTIS